MGRVWEFARGRPALDCAALHSSSGNHYRRCKYCRHPPCFRSIRPPTKNVNRKTKEKCWERKHRTTKNCGRMKAKGEMLWRGRKQHWTIFFRRTRRKQSFPSTKTLYSLGQLLVCTDDQSFFLSENRILRSNDRANPQQIHHTLH